jgi:hypothetical protein
MVAGRIPGDAFQRVDAADADVEFVGAQVLDGLGIAVGHLPLLGQQGRPAGRLLAMLQHPASGVGVPGGVVDRDDRQQAGRNSQDPAADRIERVGFLRA